MLPAFLSAGAAVVLFGLALLMVYEAIALATRRKPLTAYVREANRLHPDWMGMVWLGVGLLLGHLFWR